MRYKLSPGWTIWVFTQPAGGPHGTTVAVAAMGGTYSKVPTVKSMEVRQFFALRFSGVVL